MNLAKFITCTMFLLVLFAGNCWCTEGIWASLNGPDYIPKTDDIAIGYSDGNRFVFLADSSAEGSILRMTNQASKWENIASGYYPVRIRAGWNFGNIAVMMVSYAYSNRGVYFSFNADNEYPSQVSWQSRWAGLPMQNTQDLEVIQNSIDETHDHITAFVVRGNQELVTEQKIFKTIDSGENWYPQTTGIRDNYQFEDIEIFQNSPDYITTSGFRVEQSEYPSPIICHSSDEGASWSIIGDGTSFNNPLEGKAFKAVMSKKEVIYVCLEASNGFGNNSNQIWKTTDAGQTWLLKWEETNNEEKQILNMIIANANTDTPPSADTLIVSLRERGILCSTDGGDQWQYRNNGLCSFSGILALEQDPHNVNCVFAGPYGAPFQTNDLGLLWHDIAKGSFPDKVTAVAKNGSLLFTGAYQNTRMTVSEDELLTRTQIHGRFIYGVHNIKFDPYRPGYLWALSSEVAGNHSQSEIIYTNDAAQSCNDWNTAFLSYGSGGWDLNELDFTHENGYNRLWCCGRCGLNGPIGVIKYTENDGILWNDISLLSCKLNSLSANRSSQYKILVGSDGEGIFRRVGLQNTFELINNGLSDLNIQKVLYQHFGTNVGYCGTPSGVFRSTNVDALNPNSVVWNQENYGLSNPDVISMILNPIDESVILASTQNAANGYVYVSADSARSWLALYTGLSNLKVWDFAIDENDQSYFYAGTDNGVYKINNPVKSGTLTQNETWGPGLVIINGDVTIPSGDTLNILAGTTLKFIYNFDITQSNNPDLSEIIVHGQLTANGSSGSPIVFTSSEPMVPKAGDWSGILVYDGASINLNHFSIQYAENGVTAEEGASVLISNSHFADCSNAGFWGKGVCTPNYLIQNSVFTECGIYGILCNNGQPNILSDTISGNIQYGIKYLGGGKLNIESNVITTSNTTNSQWGIYISPAIIGDIPDPTLEGDSVMYYHQGGIYLAGTGTNGTLNGNIRSKHNGTYGLYLANSSPTVNGIDFNSHNTFNENFYGIYCDRGSGGFFRWNSSKENRYCVYIQANANPDFGTSSDSGYNSFKRASNYTGSYDMYSLNRNTISAIGNYWNGNSPRLYGNINYRPLLLGDPIPGMEKRRPETIAEAIDLSIANYPNPFNTNTEIKFGLVQSGQVSVKVFDISGRLVKELANNTYDAGEHTIIWDGTNSAGEKVSSGVYLYSISTAQNQITKKMVMLK